MYNKHKMYEGGSVAKPRSAQVFRFAGLFIPAALIIYMALVQIGFIKTERIIDNFGLLVFSFWWLYISFIQFLFPIKSKLDATLRLTVYHLLAGSCLIFVSGLSSPIIVLWLLLVAASYAYFSKTGLIFSILSLIIFAFIDIILWFKIDDAIVLSNVVAVLSVAITGIIIMSISKFQDISRRELLNSKAQESLQRDRVLTIVNNLADAVLSTDMAGIIRVYNAASLNLLDTNVSLNGRHIDEILPLIDQDNKEMSLFKEFQKVATVTKRDDLYFAYNEDDKIRLEITFSPIRSSYSRSKKAETHDGYIIILRDITKSKSLEEERDEFISVVSHELRTPIAIAEGTISNVQVMMGHPDVTESMLKDAIKVAHDQIIFLAGMVNDLSTLSRAERGAADSAEDIDVQALAHELHTKYADDAKSRKLHLNIDLSPKLGKIHVSRLYLEELLQNIITNALKYTKKGSITIAISQKNGVISFSVKDTGIGISKSDQSKLFNKFYRSEDYRTRESSGTGLGLYIVAKLAHKMGTKVKLTSRLNFGSTFSFTLPVIEQ